MTELAGAVLVEHIGEDRSDGVVCAFQGMDREHAMEGACQDLAGLVGLFVTAIHPCGVAACNPFANRAAEKTKGGTDCGWSSARLEFTGVSV